MDNFVWIDRKHIYINKLAITSIEQYKFNTGWDNYWKVKMNDGDYFVVNEYELNLILGDNHF